MDNKRIKSIDTELDEAVEDLSNAPIWVREPTDEQLRSEYFADLARDIG